MSLTIWFRIVMALLGLVALTLSTIIATQNTGLSQQTLVWMGIALTVINSTLAAAPSVLRTILPDNAERATLRSMKE